MVLRLLTEIVTILIRPAMPLWWQKGREKISDGQTSHTNALYHSLKYVYNIYIKKKSQSIYLYFFIFFYLHSFLLVQDKIPESQYIWIVDSCPN